MIQRIQSIWFLLAAITTSTLFFVPFVTNQSPEKSFYINGLGLFEVVGDQSNKLASNSTFILAIGILIAFYLFAIFQYKNRKLQKMIGLLANFFALGIAYWSSQLAKTIPGSIESRTIEPGLFIPAMAIVFCLLAIRAIKQDEKLLKSADRLR
ncbi:MAG: DUF4293 family protein [Pedobacter sp.]|nr:MAG: DUF4293 family protein [Pedobacter sp.]